MKKTIFLWVPIFMMAIANITFVSCSDDDNVEPEKNKQKESPQEQQNEVISVSPDYTPVTWEDTEIYESNPEDGVFSFESTDETRKIEVGSVLAIDEGSTGRIAIVKEVSKDGDRVTVTTEEGSLCDIFSDCEITLSSNETEAITRYAGKGNNVYTPSQVFVDGEEISDLLTKASTSDTPITHNLWNWGLEFNDTELFRTSNARVYLEEANFSASLDIVIHLSFGNRSAIVATANAYHQYRSKALWVNASVKGSLSTNLAIKAVASGKATMKCEEDELWKHNIFKPIDMKFVIQGIPVFVTLNADLFRGASLDFDGDITFYTATHNKAEGSVGFEWQQSGTIFPIYSMNMSNELVYPTVIGKGIITGKTWLYPRVHLSLYRLIGPSFDIKPYLGCSVSGGFKEQLMSSSQDYCAWQLRNFAGLDVSAGLSLKFMNYETNNFNIGTLHVTEKDLYRSPTKIEFYDSEHDKVQGGVKNKVSFKVYDTNVLFGQEVITPLSQLVKFEAPGTLSSKYGIAKDGIVSVEWTPASNEDKLTAVLYNAEGGVISKVEWGEPAEEVSYCPDNNHPHAIDLGLPSGTKWACCNVGATSPSGYGGYYAWGETATKSEYNWSTYKYLNKSKKSYIDIGSNIAGTQYDVATTNWGAPWRMPSETQMQELLDYTTSKWTTQNGVFGLKFTGSNGGTVFLPAAGGRQDGEIGDEGTGGYYWSSSSSSLYEIAFYVGQLYFAIKGAKLSRSGYGIRYSSRLDGHTVRPVR